MALKKGQKLTINGEKLIVASINDDGTATLNYAAGSGKSGFRGKIVNPDAVKAATSPKAMFVDSIDPIEEFEDGRVSMESYNNFDSNSKGESSTGSHKQKADALLKRGIEASRVTDALTTPVSNGKLPNDEQISSRLDFLEAEKNYWDKVKEIDNKKFPFYTAFYGDSRIDYWNDAEKELIELEKKVRQAKDKNAALEGDSSTSGYTHPSQAMEKISEDYEDTLGYVNWKIAANWHP